MPNLLKLDQNETISNLLLNLKLNYSNSKIYNTSSNDSHPTANDSTIANSSGNLNVDLNNNNINGTNSNNGSKSFNENRSKFKTIKVFIASNKNGLYFIF